MARASAEAEVGAALQFFDSSSQMSCPWKSLSIRHRQDL
ncbi:hypothetical protein GQ607_005409 [Colletotrichum asianum]|uniref:Uncharacterized protein n=1 Tax=Colletotrichum asianum TaxID=702518 RepID=A0A8H3ZWR9_9PEZI|nr:hypothetical protein GQ607_005409 [Colletotrichum asianum]